MSAGEIHRTGTDAAAASKVEARSSSAVPVDALSGANAPCVSTLKDVFTPEARQSIWNPEDAAPRSVSARTAPHGLMLSPAEFVSPRLDRMGFEGGWRDSFEKLFHENVRAMLDPSAAYEGGVTESARLSEAELAEAFDRSTEQFSRIRGTAFANEILPEFMPGVIEEGLRSGIPVDRIPHAIEEVWSERTIKRVRVAIEEGLLRMAESIAEKGPQGSVAEVREPFKARVQDAAVATGMGVGTWLAAEEAAELLGINNPTMRFAFVIYTMHYGMQGIDAGMEVAKSIRAGEAAGAAIRARIATAVAGETVAARAATLARGAGRVPIDLVRGIGVGLLMSKAVGGLADKAGVDPEMASLIATAAFFSEMPINRLTGGRFAQACSRFGVAAVGEIAAIAMLAEVAAEGAAMAMRGDDNDYALSLESRAADANDEMMWDRFVHGVADWPSALQSGAYVLYGFSEVAKAIVGFFLPGAMMRLKAVNYTLRTGGTIDSTIGNDEFWKKDQDQAIKISRDLPMKLRGVLERGLYGDDLDPEFYRSVDLGWISEAADPDNNDNAGAYIESGAAAVSTDIVSLHFFGYSSGERIRGMFDRDGFDEIEMKEGMEEEFLKEFVAPAYRLSSGSSADEIRAAVIRARKKNLVAAILGADFKGDAKRRRDLLKAAAEAGVLDRELGFDPAIFSETIKDLAVAAGAASDEADSEMLIRVMAHHMGHLEMERMKRWSEGLDPSNFTRRIDMLEAAMKKGRDELHSMEALKTILSSLPPVEAAVKKAR
ncbi:MAG: hypothetical protein JXA24_03860 [Proteobacteria bacterium]|nr:hypothetical protein [Pseudomonadota bacterium]